MRCAIETVPKNGQVVILEDETSGTYELARWSAQECAWVGENDKPCKITPTHWLAINRAESPYQQESSPSNLEPQAIISDRAERRMPPEAPMSDRAEPRLQTVLPTSDRTELHVPPVARFPPVAPISDQAEPRLPRLLGQLASRAESRSPPVAPDIFAPRPITKPATGMAATFDEKTIDERTGRGNARPTVGGRRIAVFAIGAVMVVASLVGMEFRAQVVAYVSQFTDQINNLRVGTLGRQAVPEIALPVQAPQKTTKLEPDAAFGQRTDAGGGSRAAAAPLAEAMTTEGRHALEAERRRADALEKNLAEARQEIVTNAMRIQALAEAGERVGVLGSELANTRRDVEAQAALSSKLIEDAARRKRAGDTATAELQQSLRQERDRTEALARDLVILQGDVKALSSKTSDEAAQVKKTAKTAIAELQQTLQQERDKTLALESELAKARRDIDQAALSRKTSDELGQLNPVAESATAIQQKRDPTDRPTQLSKSTPDPTEAFASGWFGRDVNRSLPSNQMNKAGETVRATRAEQLVAVEANGSQEAGRLVERANALLARRYIGRARSVLERAAATGNAQATFRLAETYDPLVLANWRATRTRGDAKKAGELYAKAYDGGVKAAKDRSDALRLSVIPVRR
jgi:hypothetical protein